MGESLISFRDGTFIIDGCEVSGITDFTANMEAVEDYVEEHTSIVGTDILEYTVTILNYNMFTWFKLTGLWSWIEDNCPNRKLVWLMNHGKTKRIRIKNLNRAYREIAKILTRCKGE